MMCKAGLPVMLSRGKYNRRSTISPPLVPMPLLIHTILGASKFLCIPNLEAIIYRIICSYGNIISSTTNFAAFWKTLATEFASNEKVIFDTSN
jgi:hypothetical protein